MCFMLMHVFFSSKVTMNKLFRINSEKLNLKVLELFVKSRKYYWGSC